MRIIYIFLSIILFQAVSQAHPGTALEKLRSNSQPIIVNGTAHENLRNKTSSYLQDNPAGQRPRFYVTYENVYKPSPGFMNPVDPFQNILLYFLMNFGRELSQSPSDESKMEFISDARNKIGEFGTQKYSPNRELLEDEQKEEIHIFPHVDGTCMCFNRRERRSKDAAAENKLMKRNSETAKAENTTNETIDLKVENQNLSVSNGTGKNRISVRDVSAEKSNHTIVKVMKLGDFNESVKPESKAKLTANKNNVTDEEILITGEEFIDLHLASGKDKSKLKSQPLNIIPTTENTSDQHNATLSKVKRDNGYYFLSSSGGTAQRTTASNTSVPRKARYTEDTAWILKRYASDFNKKRNRVRRHVEKIKKYIHENLKTRSVKNIRKNESDADEIQNPREHEFQGVANLIESRTNCHSTEQLTTLKNTSNLKDITFLKARSGDKGISSLASNFKSLEEPTTHERKQQNSLSSTIPSLLGIGSLLVIIGYIMKTKGWLPSLIHTKSYTVTMQPNKDT